MTRREKVGLVARYQKQLRKGEKEARGGVVIATLQRLLEARGRKRLHAVHRVQKRVEHIAQRGFVTGAVAGRAPGISREVEQTGVTELPFRLEQVLEGPVVRNRVFMLRPQRRE